MTYELSCGLPPGPEFADLAELAETLGYRRIWIFGSEVLWEDPFLHLALAARRTSHIGLATAVTIVGDRSEMSMASSIATLARLSEGRFRPCFGTGYTARMAMGRRPSTVPQMIDEVATVRSLLRGETVSIDGAAARMLHVPGMGAQRPVDAEIWLSVFGPVGVRRAAEVADGIIGPPHPTLPSATMVSGTVLDPGEARDSERVRRAIGPWAVLAWHNAYAHGGAAAVDAMPGGREWREQLEALEPEGRRHLLTFEGHVSHLMERDEHLLDHLGLDGGDSPVRARSSMIGEADEVASRLTGLAAAGFREIIYTPSGPDVARELRAFAAAGPR